MIGRFLDRVLYALENYDKFWDRLFAAMFVVLAVGLSLIALVLVVGLAATLSASATI